MRFEEVFCQKCISKSALADYAVNPYVGCQHQCVYCYVPYITRNPDWKTSVKAKVNLHARLAKELASPKIKRGSTFFLASTTDPYQPLESKYGLSSDALRQLTSAGMRVIVQTKSPLILKNIDVLKENSAEVEVGFTVLGMDGRFKDALEPASPSIESRLKAIEKLSEVGVRVYAFLGPVIPGWTDVDLNELLMVLREAGVAELSVDKLRLRPGMAEEIIAKMPASHFASALELAQASQAAYVEAFKSVRDFAEKNHMVFSAPFSYRG